MIRRLIIPPAASIAAALGLALLLIGRDALGLLLMSLAVGAMALLMLVGRLKPSNPLGHVLSTRALITVCSTGALAVRSPGTDWPVALGALILTSMLLGERMLRPVSRYHAPVVAHLPTLPVPRSRPSMARPVVLAGLGANAMALLIAAASGPAWLWLPVTMVATTPAALVIWDGRTKRRCAATIAARLPQAVAAYAPELVLYTARPDDASYQVTMWLPYLERTGRRFIIVTRSPAPAEALAALTEVPVIEAGTVETLDSLVVASLRGAFYVNASSGNGSFVRHHTLQHVYLGHGDSDKAPSYNPTHAMYDQIFVAGPAAARRYAEHDVHIPPEKLRVVGRPQVEDVRPPAAPISTVEHPTVLYAPTWRGHVEETMLYSLPSGEAIVAALLARGATVIFRPHPFNARFAGDARTIRRIQARLAADARTSGRRHVFGRTAENDWSVVDCMNAADAMVSDVSAVVADYLVSGKPLAMVAVPSDPEVFTREYPISRASYVIRGDLANLGDVLDDLLGADPLAGERLVVRSDYLGDFPLATYSAAFVQAVLDVASIEPVHELELPEPEHAVHLAPADYRSTWPALLSHRLRLVGRTLHRAGLEAATALAALVAFGAELSDAPAWVVSLLTALAVGGVAWSIGPILRTPHRIAGSGVSLVARAILVVQVAVVGFTCDERYGSIVLVSCALAGTLALESRVLAAYRATHPETRNLPGLETGGYGTPPALIALSQVTATALGLVLAVADPPMWPVGLALIVAVGVVLRRTPLTAAQLAAAEGRFRRRLEELRPEFVAYFASTVGAGYQMGMWLPYFDRIGRPWLVIARSPSMMSQIDAAMSTAGVQVPIIYRPTLRSVEEAIVPSLTTAFYVNNASRNTHLIERRELTHVWLNHGDSEKPACYNPVHSIYDVIFAAGQAGIDRYERHGVQIPRQNFMIVGRPQVERITPARGPIATLPDPTVLYAPTWQGLYSDSRIYSLPMGRTIVGELLRRGVRVIFRAHPLNYRFPGAVALIDDIGAMLRTDRAATGRQHLWGRAAERSLTVEECFNEADAMISDVSAVVSDFLQSGKPLSIVSVGREPDELVEDVPAARAAYVLRHDCSNLAAVCDDLLRLDPLAERRRTTRAYHLGDFPEDRYADGFLDAARSVIDGTLTRPPARLT